MTRARVRGRVRGRGRGSMQLLITPQYIG